MKKKYYYVTIKNIFDEQVKRDIIAEEINGELYDILLGNKIYVIDRKDICNDFYFDKEKYINGNYKLIGIVFSEVSKIFVINYFKDMKKDILRKMNEIKEYTDESLKSQNNITIVKLYKPKNEKSIDIF